MNKNLCEKNISTKCDLYPVFIHLKIKMYVLLLKYQVKARLKIKAERTRLGLI